MTDKQFIEHLKKYYPYLYDIEMEIRRVVATTRFGNPSFSLRIIEGVVQCAEIIGSQNRQYYKQSEILNVVKKNLTNEQI